MENATTLTYMSLAMFKKWTGISRCDLADLTPILCTIIEKYN